MLGVIARHVSDKIFSSITPPRGFFLPNNQAHSREFEPTYRTTDARSLSNHLKYIAAGIVEYN